jgi:uracil-DNA glycosylase family 4
LTPCPERQTLADPAVKARRIALIDAPNVAALNALVTEIRTECRCLDCVPHFDPADGGVVAKVLFVLEAPGPQAIASGFVSCDNPDLSARNMTALLAEAGIERGQIVVWNIVPWYLGDEKKIRPATKRDTDAGMVYLQRLLPILPQLRAVVFVGRHAQRATRDLELPAPLRRFESFHPSPQFIHRHPDNWTSVLEAFRKVAEYLYLEQVR